MFRRNSINLAGIECTSYANATEREWSNILRIGEELVSCREGLTRNHGVTHQIKEIV